jgi:WD40 repeat protein
MSRGAIQPLSNCQTVLTRGRRYARITIRAPGGSHLTMPADPKAAHVAVDYPAEAPLMACRFDPAGKFVFASAENFKIYRWDVADPKRRVALAGHNSWVYDLVITPDGQTLISAGGDDSLIWWAAAAEAPTEIRKVRAHDGWIRALALSPDGKLLASGGNDRVVRLWNVADGAKVREFTGAARDIYSLAFHPSGQWLLAGDLDGKIHQWNVADGALVKTFDATPLHVYEGGQQVHYGGVRAIAFRPDAKQFVAGGLHKGSNPLGNVQEPLMLRFNWEDVPPPPAPADPKTGVVPPPPIGVKPVRTHLSDGNPNERIWSLAYHAQGFVVAAIGGGKGALLFWNEGEDKPFHTFALPNTARGLSLHADGIQVATTHHDSKLRVTRLEAKKA